MSLCKQETTQLNKDWIPNKIICAMLISFLESNAQGWLSSHAHRSCSSGWGQLRFSEALRHTACGPGRLHSAREYFLTDLSSSHQEDWACWANTGRQCDYTPRTGFPSQYAEMAGSQTLHLWCTLQPTHACPRQVWDLRSVSWHQTQQLCYPPTPHSKRSLTCSSPQSCISHSWQQNCHRPTNTNQQSREELNPRC